MNLTGPTGPPCGTCGIQTGCTGPTDSACPSHPYYHINYPPRCEERNHCWHGGVPIDHPSWETGQQCCRCGVVGVGQPAGPQDHPLERNPT